MSAVPCAQAILAPQGPPDMHVELGAVPDGVQGSAVRRGRALVGCDETIFRTDRVADFWIARGARIVVAPKPGRPLADVASLLLGAPIGAALHQRGTLALHGAAVCRDGRAVVIVGHSGSGKSTSVAALVHRGFTVLDDNIAVLTERDGTFMVQPGVAELRLRDEASYPAGCGEPAPFLRGLGKTRASIRDYFQPEPAPLAAIYAIAPGDVSAPVARPLTRPAAFVAVRGCVFCRYLESIEHEQRMLPVVARLVAAAPVMELQRPRVPTDPALVAALVEHDLRRPFPEN